MLSKRTTLDRLRPGERGKVGGCRGDGPVIQRLCEMGFVEGATLRLVRLAPFGDPLEVELADCHVSLRRAEAAMIEIELGGAAPAADDGNGGAA